MARHTQSMSTTDFDYALMAEYDPSQFEVGDTGRRLKRDMKPIRYIFCDFNSMPATSGIMFATLSIEEMAMKVGVSGIDTAKILFDDGTCLDDEDAAKFKELMHIQQ